MNKQVLIGAGVGGLALAGLFLSRRANATEVNQGGKVDQPTSTTNQGGAVTAPPVTAQPPQKPVTNTSLPRGIRNNNPGNIKKGPSQWVGKIGNDGVFETFDTAENGIRAMARLLRTYRNSYGLNTIRGIIQRWTSGDPAMVQNNYVAHIVNKTGIAEHLQLIGVSQYAAVVEQMIYFENGQQPYSKAMITKAVQDGMA
jgi:hypothetical protein